MKRVYINLATFALIATVLIAWSAVNFLHIDAIEHPYVVTAEFAQSPGLRPGYDVAYLGHSIGHIRDIHLAPGRSDVRLAIDHSVSLPADVVAAARRRSAIGEPYVDLSPAPGSDAKAGARLADGDRIPLSRTSSPIEYGQLFRSMDRLANAIDPTALATVVKELATALNGRGDDIRQIIQSSQQLSTSLAAQGDKIDQLVDGLDEITTVLADHRDAIGSTVDDLASLTATLQQAQPSAQELLTEGPSTIAMMNTIIDASESAVICTVDGTAVLDAVLDRQGVDAVRFLLQHSASFADVIRLVQDPRDGIFRLMVSPSGGNPPTVEFNEPKPFPGTPPLPSCPSHPVRVEAPPLADQSAPGAGGRRSSGGTATAAPDPDNAAPTGPAAVPSHVQPSRTLFARAVSWAEHALPVAVLVLALGLLWLITSRRRERQT